MTDVVFLNPTAGAGRAGRVWAQLEDQPNARGVEVVASSAAGDAARTIDTALARRPARIIAVGGDGTAHLVASRILAAGLGAEVVFGLVPAGTGSDLARTLGVPGVPTEALTLARDQPPRRIDAVSVERDPVERDPVERDPVERDSSGQRPGRRRFAVNIASIGVSGAVDQAVNAAPRGAKSIYLRATLRALLGYRPAPWRLVLDGEPFFEGPFFVAAFANGPSFGGGMRVAPGAVCDDGLADVVVVQPVALWALPWRMPQFMSGRHIGSRHVEKARGRVLRAEPLDAGPLPPFDLDGETCAAGPATFRLLPGALTVAAPPGDPTGT